MDQDSRRSPSWHPDELAFLSKHWGFEPPDGFSKLTCIKKRWIYNTLREVFLTENGYVIKRYCHFPGRKDYRKVWQREHDALIRLKDFNTPNSMGYVSVNHNAEVTGTLHLRTLLPGSTVNWANEATLKSLAKLIADIHKRHVVILDPQHENFILTHSLQQPVGFIDFGRARVFSGMTPLMLIHIGKDLAKLKIDSRLNYQQFEVFSQYYQQSIQLNVLQNSVVNLSVDYWLRRKMKKRGKCEAKPD